MHHSRFLLFAGLSSLAVAGTIPQRREANEAGIALITVVAASTESSAATATATATVTAIATSTATATATETATKTATETATETATATPSSSFNNPASLALAQVFDQLTEGIDISGDAVGAVLDTLDLADTPLFGDLAGLAKGIELKLNQLDREMTNDKRDEGAVLEMKQTDNFDDILRGLGLMVFDQLFPGNDTEAGTEARKQRRAVLKRFVD